MYKKWSKVLALTLSALMVLPLTAMAEEGSTTPPATEQPAPTTPTDGTTTPDDGTTTPDDGTTTPDDGTTTPDCATPPVDEAPAEGAQTTVAVSVKGNSGKATNGQGSATEHGAPSSSHKPATTTQSSGTTETEPDDDCDSSTPATNHGQAQAAAAHAKVATRLQAMLDAGKITNATAQTNVQAVITKMIGELKAGGDATTEEEALTAIEETVEAEGQTATTAELDVLAQAQVQLGKKDKAKATLKTRLKKESTTKSAYVALIKLEQESGEAVEMDTYVNGEKIQFDVRPKVKEGRTLVPIRALVEKLGAQVSWDQATSTVTIVKGTTEIKLVIGSNIALVNGEEVQLDAAAEVEAGRTLIPTRFVSQKLGLYVSWLAEQRTILVTEQPVEEEPAPAPEQPVEEAPAPVTEQPAPEPQPAPAPDAGSTQP
ncbi:MAG TPA: copper amine oxidase N-terminal domain-containing protein [Symbiobacteriaceae bacterium]|nr:copper amine oxidase N-terminal domain-containing protein [Symbiobacteriaceae bacterium]